MDVNYHPLLNWCSKVSLQIRWIHVWRKGGHVPIHNWTRAIVQEICWLFNLFCLQRFASFHDFLLYPRDVLLHFHDFMYHLHNFCFTLTIFQEMLDEDMPDLPEDRKLILVWVYFTSMNYLLLILGNNDRLMMCNTSRLETMLSHQSWPDVFSKWPDIWNPMQTVLWSFF